ncbi:hypothetical protein B0A55_13673 [Friedmanniomyces simplex]|uniref:Uncharacterized protein n=1 Tax=Friedmanniomyces simplex TaxID=329884 RepID=A0A4U0VUP6_9PEZI|nr:hypothetical protein B0A55_13673 [Friedmanniomyces simplex]
MPTKKISSSYDDGMPASFHRRYFAAEYGLDNSQGLSLQQQTSTASYLSLRQTPSSYDAPQPEENNGTAGTEQTGGAEQGGESGYFDSNAFMDFELQTSLILSGMIPNAMHSTVNDHRPSNMAAHKSLQHFFTPAVGQATQKAAGHPEVKPDYAAAYNGIFPDEASCDAYWSSTQGVDYTPLSIEDDDVDEVSDGQKDHFIQAIFNTITDAPGPAPSGATHVEQENYKARQQTALSQCKTKLGADDYKRTYAGCAKLYYRAVRLHQEGIPTQLLKKKAATTTTGYSVDLNSKFTQRMANIIDAVSGNKRVVCDVLKAERLDHLVRSPKAFVDRKLHNCKCNGQKGRDLQEIKVNRTRGQAIVQAPWHVFASRVAGLTTG